MSATSRRMALTVGHSSLNIVLVNHNVAESRGTYFRVKNLGLAMARAGHTVTVVTTSASRRLVARVHNDGLLTYFESPALFSGPIRNGFDPLDVMVRWLAATPRQFPHVDVVHAFDCRPTVILPALRLARTTGAQLFIDWADWWGRGGTTEERRAGRRFKFILRPLETFFEESYRTRADYTTVISTALESRAKSLGVPADRITLLAGGADSQAIYPRPIAESRKAAGLPPEGHMVGYLGSIYDRDAELLASSFSELRSRVPGLKMLIIGDLAENLRELPGLIRTGRVPYGSLPDYLGSCDLFLLPLSDTVGNRGRWPGKINLYMAAGRATVATPVGEVRRIFETYGGGALAPFEDGRFVNEAEALLRDPARLEAIGDEARRVAVSVLDWRLLGDQLVGLYRSNATEYRVPFSERAPS